jgi:hypothetical protein
MRREKATDDEVEAGRSLHTIQDVSVRLPLGVANLVAKQAKKQSNQKYRR